MEISICPLGFHRLPKEKLFSAWSGFKRALFFERGGLYMASVAGAAAILVLLLITGRKILPAGSLPAGFALLGMEFTELGATVADAADMDRHLMIFFALFDMALIAVFYLIAAHVSAGRLSRTRGRNVPSVVEIARR